MRESVGYTVTLNIVIVFIVIVFAFISAALVYYKSNKISNVIMDAIEKYEGYNKLAEEEILKQISNLGYNIKKINCPTNYSRTARGKKEVCSLVENNTSKGIYYSNGTKGYCVYECIDLEAGIYSDYYYYYKIRTNMMINIPIVNNLLDIPIYSNTNRLFDFNSKLS